MVDQHLSEAVCASGNDHIRGAAHDQFISWHQVRRESMEALLINVGTLVAIAGIAFSITLFMLGAVVFIDNGRRWFR